MFISQKLLLFLIFLFFSTYSFSQEKSESIRVIGDSLVGRVVDGESIREVIGKVLLTQGNVVVTCDKAIQYLLKNEAELIGNVVVNQDSLTLTTPTGFYFGDVKMTKSVSGIILDDKKVILSADSGEYFFDSNIAVFQSNVSLIDSVTTLNSDELIYFKNEDKAIAVDNVIIKSENSIINADSLEHFRKSKTSFAFGNVKISSLENNTIVYGDHLEDYGEQKFTIIDKNPLLVQIDTSYQTGEDTLTKTRIDTLVIKCLKMEAIRGASNLFRAIDSVKIVRGEFASLNDLTLYFRSDDKIITEKSGETTQPPVLWYENSQLTGDSITIYLEENNIKNLDVINNSFMLSQHKVFQQRYDQTSSNNVKINFNNDKIQNAVFDGNVRSIYYLYEDEKPNGLTKSASNSATLVFEENEVSEVRLYGSPSSEYHPENKVIGIERTFTLPKFVFNQNRPLKEELISTIK